MNREIWLTATEVRTSIHFVPSFRSNSRLNDGEFANPQYEVSHAEGLRVLMSVFQYGRTFRSIVSKQAGSQEVALLLW
jgi:hypothetical protein